MGLLYSFINGGSERLGALIAHHLAAEGWPIEICATHTLDGPVRSWLERRGVPAFGMQSGADSRIGRRWRLYRLLRRRRIEVLHVQHFSMLALCYWPARLAGVRRIVVTEHNEQLIQTNPRMIRRSRFYGTRADLVTVIHDGIRRYLVDELGIPETQVQTIRNGVDTERFAPAERDPAIRGEFGAGPDELLVGSVGRLHPDKNQRALLHGLERVRRQASTAASIRLVLIGDGDEREPLERLCAQLGLSDVVCFAGDRDDVERMVPQLDAFVLPSMTEGVPLVLLEAMACGVPCVATRVGGVPELFAGGGGRLVEPDDADALAAELAELANDAGARERLGARAREIATSRHELVDMLATYRRALVGCEPRAAESEPSIAAGGARSR